MTQMQVIPIQQCQTGLDFVNTIFSTNYDAIRAIYADGQLHNRCKKALDSLPTFGESGDYTGYVVYIGTEKSQWENEPGVIYLCMYLYDTENKKGGWWRSSTNPAYMTGNNADKTYLQATLNQLAKVNAKVENGMWGQLIPQLLNRKIPFWVSENESKKTPGKMFYKIAALGEGRKLPEPEALPGFDFGQAFPQQQPAAPAPQAAAPAPQYQQPAPQQYQQPMAAAPAPQQYTPQAAANAFGPAPTYPQQQPAAYAAPQNNPFN